MSDETLCSDCPPVGYSTDATRCRPCPRRKEPYVWACEAQLPPDAEGFAVLGDDGKFDPDCIYSDCPADWSRLHGRPVYRVKITPIAVAADYYGDLENTN